MARTQLGQVVHVEDQHDGGGVRMVMVRSRQENKKVRKRTKNFVLLFILYLLHLNNLWVPPCQVLEVILCVKD